MTATAILDEQGRLIIPEELREHVHLAPGDSFEISEEQGKVVLFPVSPKSSLKRVGDLLIVDAELEPEYKDRDLIADMREERIRDILR